MHGPTFAQTLTILDSYHSWSPSSTSTPSPVWTALHVFSSSKTSWTLTFTILGVLLRGTSFFSASCDFQTDDRIVQNLSTAMNASYKQMKTSNTFMAVSSPFFSFSAFLFVIVNTNSTPGSSRKTQVDKAFLEASVPLT